MKRLTGLNGHLSNRDSSLTSCQKSSYLHINRSKIEPLPQGYEIYSFYILFLGHHYYIFRLSNLCLGIIRRFSKKLCIFTNYILPRPSTRTHVPEFMEFTILVDISLVIITIYDIFSLSDLCLSIKRFLKK